MSGTERFYASDDSGPASPVVRVDALNFGYDSPLLRGISLSLRAGQFLTLLGRSGCGKTTLLKLLGGYLAPHSGSIWLRGRDVTRLPPEKRNVGMVFQNYALFPHLTARRNVAFALEIRRVPRVERDARVEAILDLVGLTTAERERKPTRLSGGQQQRVALARALVYAPDLLLLDEPFANLDRSLRDQLRTELRRLLQAPHASEPPSPWERGSEGKIATVMVTHDQEEALAVSDLLGVMASGQLLQLGPPSELYHQPRTPFVARCLGDANLLPGTVLGESPERLVLVRPECFVLGEQTQECVWSKKGRVQSITYLGADLLAEIVCESLTLRVRTRAGTGYVNTDAEGPRPGASLWVGIPQKSTWLIPEADPLEVR